MLWFIFLFIFLKRHKQSLALLYAWMSEEANYSVSFVMDLWVNFALLHLSVRRSHLMWPFLRVNFALLRLSVWRSNLMWAFVAGQFCPPTSTVSKPSFNLRFCCGTILSPIRLSVWRSNLMGAFLRVNFALLRLSVCEDAILCAPLLWVNFAPLFDTLLTAHKTYGYVGVMCVQRYGTQSTITARPFRHSSAGLSATWLQKRKSVTIRPDIKQNCKLYLSQYCNHENT
jgi:hypothetical protein